MRIPLIEPYKNTPEEETIFLEDIYFEYPQDALIDEKTKLSFIKAVEKTVRTSIEYREYIEYLVNSVGMSVCSVFTNLNKGLSKKFKIEIHHEPFTLYDIVEIVLQKHLCEKDIIDFFDVSEEVMRVHYMGKVGLIPLSLTVHELVHKGHVFIPLQFIHEGFMQFYNEYKPYINEQLSDILVKKIDLSKTFNNQSNVALKKKIIYLKHEKYDNLPEKLQAG